MNCRWLVGLVVLAAALSGACRSATVSQTKEEYLASADKFAIEGKDSEAVIQYRNAIRVDPKFGVAHARLAEVYFRANNNAASMREFVIAADLLPNDVEAQIKAGTSLLMAGKFEDAKTRGQKALALSPKNVSAMVIIGNALAGLKDSYAIKVIEDATKVGGDDYLPFAILGRMKSARGANAEAEAAFVQAVRLDTKSVVSRLALAEFYMQAGRKDDAEKMLREAVAARPKDINGQKALASFYMSTGQTKEAEEPLKAVAAASKSLKDRLNLIDFYLNQKREDVATTLLIETVGTKDGFVPASIRLAAIDFSNKRMSDVYKRIDNVLAVQPKNVGALVAKAKYSLFEHKLDEALALAMAATAADPRSFDAQFELGTVRSNRNEVDGAIAALTEATALNPTSAATKLLLAQLLIEKGAMTQAAQFAKEAVAASPKDLSAHLTLVYALMNGVDVNRAESELKFLLKSVPDNAAVHTMMGRLLFVKGDRVGARREYDRALQLQPHRLDAVQGRAVLDINTKNPARARADLEAALETMPNQPSLLLLIAQSWAAEGKTKEQEATLRKALSVDPNNLAAFVALASLFIEQRRLPEAQAEYEALAKKRPNDVVAQTMVGLVLEGQNKPEEAQKIYEKAVAASPTAVVASNNLAYIYAENNVNLDVALQLAQSAKQQMPQSPQVDDTLGWVFYKKGLASLAIPPFEAAVKADPNNAGFRYHLGLAYAKNGDSSKARAEFDAALKRKPDMADAAEARRALGPDASRREPAASTKR